MGVSHATMQGSHLERFSTSDSKNDKKYISNSKGVLKSEIDELENRDVVLLYETDEESDFLTLLQRRSQQWAAFKMDQSWGLIKDIKRSKRHMMKLRVVSSFERSFNATYRNYLEIVFHDKEV
ncbi:zinc finger C-x8-C-x5-C-x3-H type family protein [Striga asiatica]|uniref:Zinc finger C-x8-C-x5-C-x3-H type family protein n=1 Tax=Striga asiatica TaxID=4170 RepID=A0A5A7NXA2_STRAF|nr:zinc finger C-x8-C-x5-C-x3-H type family protein [Striga asiatica]